VMHVMDIKKKKKTTRNAVEIIIRNI
jgi:hypothetical protein